MNVAIVGAGPAGLYLARLLKVEWPDISVTVLEQSPKGATWGFGVGLGGRSRREIESTDPEVHDRISHAMLFSSRQVIHLDGQERTLNYGQTIGAIERLNLLEILLAAAQEAGVVVHHDHCVQDATELAGYDIVVGADGVNSTVRSFHKDRFGTHTRYLTNHFAWYGVAKALKPSALIFRSIDAGRLVAHYYAYREDMSTFVAEMDHESWVRGGFEDMTDDQRKAIFEDVFARELEGQPLVDNRSIWRQFPVVGNNRWYVDNIVLLGDALCSAHFSIGSGTRLAMEDATALFVAIRDCDRDMAKALPAFVERRKPMRDSFGEAAQRSFDWYENVAEKMRQPLDPFIFDFLTRTGRVDEKRLEDYAPDFYKMWQAYKRGNAEPQATNMR